MRYLLDTHTFLWFLVDDPLLSPAAKALIEDEDTEIWVSIASLWEIAIKVNLEKLSLGHPYEEIADQADANGIDVLQITPNQLIEVSRIEVSRMTLHHRDPFDRLIIAQCLVEGLPILSIDAQFDAYGVQRIW